MWVLCSRQCRVNGYRAEPARDPAHTAGAHAASAPDDAPETVRMAIKDIPETGTGLSTAAVEEISPQRAPARERESP